MARGRRKLRANEKTPGNEPPPAAASAPARPRPAIAGSGRRRLLWIAALVVVAGIAAIVIARRLSSKPFEAHDPVGLDRATTEVREHIRARVARAREEPGNVERLTDLGLALAGNGYWQESREVFEQLAARLPDDPLPAYYVALSYWNGSDFDSARRELEKVVERFPRFAPARFALGSILIDSGEFEAAAGRFKEQIALEGQKSTWGRLGLAKAFLEMGRGEEAVALLEPVVEREPRLPQASYLLGSAYRAVKRLDQSVRYLERGRHGTAVPMPDQWTARLDSESRTVMRRIGIAQNLHESGRTSEAIAMLEELRVSAPDDLELLSNLGGFYLASNQIEKGRDVLLHAESVNPSHLPTLYNLIVAEIRAGTLEAALKHARRAVELAPGHYHAHLSHADVLVAMNRLDDALAAAREGIRLDPRNSAVRLAAGGILFRQNRFPEARIELEAATQVDPSNPTAWFRLCETCVKLRLVPEARMALGKGAELAPKAPQVAALSRLVTALEGS